MSTKLEKKFVDVPTNELQYIDGHAIVENIRFEAGDPTLLVGFQGGKE